MVVNLQRSLRKKKIRMELVDESDDEGGHVSGVDTDRED
jgi:hypothetical protein